MEDAPAYAESLYPELELGWAPLHAWRTAAFKLIEAPRPELYDLRRDASETANRIGEQPARASPSCAAGSPRRCASAPPSAAAAAVDPTTMERLRALGYVERGRGAPARDGALRDPKDGVHLLPSAESRHVRGARRAGARHSRAHLGVGRGLRISSWRAAPAPSLTPPPGGTSSRSPTCAQLEKDGQLTAEDAVVLGDNLRLAGRSAEAAAVLERAARENPKFPQPLLSLADVRIQEGKHADAAACASAC